MAENWTLVYQTAVKHLAYQYVKNLLQLPSMCSDAGCKFPVRLSGSFQLRTIDCAHTGADGRTGFTDTKLELGRAVVRHNQAPGVILE